MADSVSLDRGQFPDLSSQRQGGVQVSPSSDQQLLVEGKRRDQGNEQRPWAENEGKSGTPEVHSSLLASKSFSHLLSLIPTQEERMCMCVFV